MSRRRTDPLATAAALDWHRRTTAFGCRVCSQIGEQCEGVVQAHHVLRQQVVERHVDTVAHRDRLSKTAKQSLLRALLWDIRNGLGVCYRAHRRHHSCVQPIPLTLVPARALEFADELGLRHVLEKEYA